MDDNTALALIEFVRNACADQCQTIAVKHFADREQLTAEDVDPLEILAARGADDGATECRNKLQSLDCLEALRQFRARTT